VVIDFVNTHVMVSGLVTLSIVSWSRLGLLVQLW